MCTQLFVSRRDSFDDGVKKVNSHLKKYCRQNEWKFIQHRNIIEQDLNKGGLHLSFKGTQKLFKNFKLNLC